MSSRSTPLGGMPAITVPVGGARPGANGVPGDLDARLHDPARLAAIEVAGLLADDGGADAAPDGVLARVARLAALALGAPVAQVNLVTADAQIPRAAYVDPAVARADPTAWREPVELTASLCQYLVASGEPRLVEDARTDPLVVSRHAAVLRAGLVGYCAVPLRAPAAPGAAADGAAADGADEVIGSVCVVDFAPRRWTAAQVAALEDVASVAAAEVARRSLEGRTRGLADAMPQIVWTSAADGRTTFLNRRWTDYTGQDAAAGVPDAAVAFLHPDDLPGVTAAWRRRLPGGDEEGSDFTFEYRLRGRDGEYRWHLGRVVAERDATGRVARWIGTGTDVDERRRTEQALVEANALLQDQAVALEVSNQQLQQQAIEMEVRTAALAAGDTRYRALLSSIDTGFCVLELLFDAGGRARDYRFLETNATFVRQVGFGDPVGRRMREIAPDLEQFWFDTYGRVARTGEPVRFAHEAAALGRSFDVFAYRVDAPELYRVAVLFADVTAARAAAAERERLLVESEAARGAAEAANRAKAQFLANMSHELRTPLNAIGGYAQLLELGLHGPVTAEQRQALGRVQAAQRHLLGLINDVLNYAKLESGRVEYDVRALDVRDVLREVGPLVEPQMAAKGLAYEVRVPEDEAAAPFVVWADRERLAQVLVNLLSNATKFTEGRHPVTGERGRVTVDVAVRRGAGSGAPRAVGDAADPGAVFVRVADTGRGIPRDQQERVFEPFVQVRAGYAQATEGTGLGLAISRDLARGMGGDLRVRSVVGEGSTFTVSLRGAGGDGRPRS